MAVFDKPTLTRIRAETKALKATYKRHVDATPDITLTSKVIDGTFPDYTRVIPQGNTKRMEVDAAEFASAVDRVATVSSERSRAVKLSLEEDKLTLSVNAPDAGAAVDAARELLS